MDVPERGCTWLQHWTNSFKPCALSQTWFNQFLQLGHTVKSHISNQRSRIFLSRIRRGRAPHVTNYVLHNLNWSSQCVDNTLALHVYQGALFIINSNTMAQILLAVLTVSRRGLNRIWMRHLSSISATLVTFYCFFSGNGSLFRLSPNRPQWRPRHWV